MKQAMQHRAIRQKGFTLIELMIAMTLGLFIAAAAMYLFTGVNTQAKNIKNTIEIGRAHV